MIHAPIPYRAELECPAIDEAETADALIEAMTRIQRKTLEGGGAALRGAHAKGHGLLIAELHVNDGLPEELAQGLFARAAVYPAVLRFSTTSGELLDDAISTPHALAMKVVGVPGEPLEESESGATQDFLLLNAPSFAAPDASAFLRSVQRLAATTDRASLRGLGGQHAATHILGETFHSQVPLLYGRYMAKVALVPVLPSLTSLTGMTIDVPHHRAALREAVVAYFAEHEGVWALKVQLCTDLERMPIEDASVVWPESVSPYRSVATLRAAAQPAWNDARERTIESAMSFSPWNALAAHRPLGGVMRVRRAVYAATARFRRQQQSGEPADQSQLLRQLAASSDKP